MHTCRVDIHEDGIQDDCPGCAKHAENPVRGLDERMLRNLIVLAASPDRLSRARSEAELVASAKILNILEQVGRLAECGGDLIADYLRDRWHLVCSIEPRNHDEQHERLDLTTKGE